jgi:type IV secretory pathway VirB10-like protein
LAPRETTRRATSERDAAPGIGFLWVAAMALIAVGGWYFTAGSFSRANTASPPQAAAAQPPAPAHNDSPMAPPPAAPAVVAQAPTPPPTAAAKPSGKRMLTASSHSLRTKTPPAPKLVPDAISETPTRGEVVQRLESVRSSVRACAAGLSGVADLDITIAHSGVVTHVLVGGDFAGTTQGSCIARAVREARFPSFKQERFRLLYPYAI